MTELCNVIIPHFNDATRLRRCLDALTPQVTNCNSDTTMPTVDVVVVDNGSVEPIVDIESSYPDVEFLQEMKKGAAAARNKGVKSTRGAYLVFLDCDCIPREDWLKHALSAVKNNDIAGGEVELFDETAGERTGAQAFEWVFAFNQRDYIINKHFSVTANLVAKRSVFDDVGGFNDSVSEDKEWCLRARAKGYRIKFIPEMAVAHPTRSDWPALWRKWERLTREAFALHNSEGGSHLKWAFRALFVGLSPLVHAQRVILSEHLTRVEKVRALWTLVRLRTKRSVSMLSQSVSSTAS